MKKLLLVTIIFFSFFWQSAFPFNEIEEKPTPPQIRLKSWEHHLYLKKSSIFKNLMWRLVGPQFIGGRVSDIAVHPDKPFTIYIGVGAGNVWKTENNGTTWEPIFENEATFAIGDIRIAPSDPNIIWVGTGEELMARSSYAGIGVYKSTDGGKTWKNMGLHDTHHISKIVIDPYNPDIVYVAALGHLYTRNEERGLFKTTDGGKTWKKILYIADNVGVVDLVMDPSDNQTLYAATWEFDRKAWNFVEGGEGSGIYKTTDGGKTWKRLTNGFPIGKHVGRIGLAVAPSNPNVVYALLDNQAPRPEKKEKKKTSGITILQLKKMKKEEFLKIDSKILEKFLRENGVPREYTANMIKEMVRKGEITPASLAQYLLDLWADRKLHVTNIIGAEVYRSDDKGETWKKVNKDYLDIFHTYGYSFCDIRVSPDNENVIYILGVNLLKSVDGGKTFKRIDGKGVHVDHHDLWIDPNNPNRLILANDGGLNFSYDGGKTWQDIKNLPIGEFYTVSVDMNKPYNIYGGTQDNGTVYGPSDHIVDEYGMNDPWKQIGGGDGFYVHADPLDPNIVYFEYQFGNIKRKNLKDGSIKNIMPKAKIGEPPLRCNWNTPFIISHHNPFILYFGANKLFKSYDRGDHWWPISDDLTNNFQPQGDVPYSTITTISESPIRPGLIYVGTDDGNVWVTKNDGVTWEKIDQGLPKKWVSRIEASKFEEGTVYVSFTGYRDDDFEKYLYMSTDYGKTWKSIANNLPSEPINVIKEDPQDKNILYVGTDLGIYVSIDRGKSWISLCNNLPTTPVYDLVIHPRDNELVIGTHGRSVWVLDVEYIQKYIKEKIYEKEAHLFEIKPAELPRRRYDKLKSAYIYYYLNEPKKTIEIFVKDDSGKIIKQLKGTNDKGINLAIWDLTYEKKTRKTSNFVKPGTYKVEILIDKKTKLEGDICVKLSS